jgi:RNA polymerase sigma-70 factor (ECF subfamily)
MAEIDLPPTLRAAASGDGPAWEALVAAYSGRVYGLLVKQCGDRELAEELTQATFVKLVDKLTDMAGYEERGRFESWLFRIAMNKLRDEARRRKRQARPMDMGPGPSRQDAPSAAATLRAGSDEGQAGERPIDVLDRAEQVEQLRSAIAELPEADQEVLHLRHTAGLNFAQIAETLDQPLGTVLARGHRALGKLKKKMLTD